jgi:hypothetical protein
MKGFRVDESISPVPKERGLRKQTSLGFQWTGKIGQTFSGTYGSSGFGGRSPVRNLVGSVTPGDDSG